MGAEGKARRRRCSAAHSDRSARARSQPGAAHSSTRPVVQVASQSAGLPADNKPGDFGCSNPRSWSRLNETEMIWRVMGCWLGGGRPTGEQQLERDAEEGRGRPQPAPIGPNHCCAELFHRRGDERDLSVLFCGSAQRQGLAVAGWSRPKGMWHGPPRLGPGLQGAAGLWAAPFTAGLAQEARGRVARQTIAPLIRGGSIQLRRLAGYGGLTPRRRSTSGGLYGKAARRLCQKRNAALRLIVRGPGE